jgi:hypothetical protein
MTLALTKPMGTPDDVAYLKRAVKALKTGLEIQQQIVDSEIERMEEEMDTGFAHLGQLVETLIQEVRADRTEFRQRLKILEDNTNGNHKGKGKRP